MARFYIALVPCVAMIAVMSRIMSPFLVAPTLGVVTAMVFASHVRARSWVVWLSATLGVLVPWVFELVGIVSPTTDVMGDHIVLTLDGQIDPTFAWIGLPLYTVLVIGVSTMVARSSGAVVREAQYRAQLQSWQLEQLVPRARTVPT